MDKKKVIEELVDELNKYAYEYYSLDNSSVSDKEYDKKYDELKKLVETIGKESVCPSIKEMFMSQRWAYRKEKKIMMKEKL